MEALPGAVKTGLDVLVSVGLFGPVCDRVKKPGAQVRRPALEGWSLDRRNVNVHPWWCFRSHQMKSSIVT